MAIDYAEVLRKIRNDDTAEHRAWVRTTMVDSGWLTPDGRITELGAEVGGFAQDPRFEPGMLAVGNRHSGCPEVIMTVESVNEDFSRFGVTAPSGAFATVPAHFLDVPDPARSPAGIADHLLIDVMVRSTLARTREDILGDVADYTAGYTPFSRLVGATKVVRHQCGTPDGSPPPADYLPRMAALLGMPPLSDDLAAVTDGSIIKGDLISHNCYTVHVTTVRDMGHGTHWVAGYASTHWVVAVEIKGKVFTTRPV
jgi:hypothetical protein